MADLGYRIVIGLEVHVQLLTRTKLFCGCSTKFGQAPNSATCPVCIGMPGVLPVMNRHAFDLSLKAALALGCEIAPFTKWDRKNYFYPDLPKNYQISQYDLPFSNGGHLDIQTSAGPKRVGIIRVHLEEDAGKMIHDELGGRRDSFVDLNRTGTPLLEIVGQPELSSPEEAKAYLEELRLLLREIEVSDCEMQEGSLRCDANVNLHVPQGCGFAATPIVEIKNLNSFRAVERATKYEAERQYEQFKRDGKKLGDPGVSKATAGWDESRGITVIQRRKEEASDYRYFPDPDLVPVQVDAAWIDRTRAGLGELPAAQLARLQSQYHLSAYDAEVLTRHGKAFVGYFEEAVRLCGDAKAVSNWTTNEVLRTLNERKLGIKDYPVSPAGLAGLIKQVSTTGLNAQRAREVFARMLDTGVSAEQASNDLGITAVGDENELLAIVKRAIAANAKAVADFKKGKVKAADAIKGAVMRETRGMARTDVVQKLLMQELEKNGASD